MSHPFRDAVESGNVESVYDMLADDVLGLLRRGHAPELTDEEWPMRLTSCLTACQRHFEQRIRLGEELATNFELTRAQWDRLLAARSALRDLASVSDAPVR